jgi:hypothetical protein
VVAVSLSSLGVIALPHSPEVTLALPHTRFYATANSSKGNWTYDHQS